MKNNDKNFCMSSYLAFRYIEDLDKNFPGFKHELIKPVPEEDKDIVFNIEEMDKHIKKVFESLKNEKLGIMLSGGMDSAILATYMPKGSDAYTFRFLNGEFQKEELAKAENYAKICGLKLHYVDINWDTSTRSLKILMESKGAPVHSIEPQIYEAAMQAKKDGVTCMIVGESADLIFGGMDGLLSRDWKYEDFVNRYTFLNPEKALVNPVSMNYLYERYRINIDYLDFERFLDEVFSIESSSSYLNAFKVAGMKYCDPYSKMKMGDKLDSARVRSGDTKYLVRELFKKRYGFDAPNKTPMPRPVDIYFKDWEGPKREEFRKDIDMSSLTGNQKWQLYCLERFLDDFDL